MSGGSSCYYGSESIEMVADDLSVMDLEWRREAKPRRWSDGGGTGLTLVAIKWLVAGRSCGGASGSARSVIFAMVC